jgi:predicted LPLAT superfamily acyltransferase
VLPVLETSVQVPVPIAIVLPAKVAVVVVATQSAWSGPALAAVGVCETVMTVAALGTTAGITQVPFEVITILTCSLLLKVPLYPELVAPGIFEKLAPPLVLTCH